MKDWKYSSWIKQPRCKIYGRYFHVGGSLKRRRQINYGLLVCPKCRKEKNFPIINKNC